MSREISRRYSKAFFEVAAEKKEEERLLDEINSLAHLYVEEISFRELIRNPAFSMAEREKVLGEIFEKMSCSTLGRIVMKYLLEKKRLHFLPQLAEEYFIVLNQKKGRAFAEIGTAYDLSRQEQEELKKELKGVIGKEILLKVNKESDLIGGVRVKIGSVVLEHNVRFHLEKMRQNLMGQ